MARKTLRHCLRCRRETMHTVKITAMPTARVVTDPWLLKHIGQTYDRVEFQCVPCAESIRGRLPWAS